MTNGQLAMLAYLRDSEQKTVKVYPQSPTLHEVCEVLESTPIGDGGYRLTLKQLRGYFEIKGALSRTGQ